MRRHRRLSQDRAGMPDRLQKTRIDAEHVIEAMIAQSVQDTAITPRISDQGTAISTVIRHTIILVGLALFVSKDGESAVLTTSGVKASDSFEKVQIADSSPG